MKKLLCAALVLHAAAVWAQPNESPADQAAARLARCGDCAQVLSVIEEKRRHANTRLVWVTTVKMRNGRVRSFVQHQRPAWGAGDVVHVRHGVLSRA